MNFSDYKNLPGINASFLKACAKSAYDGFQYLHFPLEPTDAMRFGTALHTYFLERPDFYNRYAVSPKFDRRTKEGKVGYEAFLAKAGNKELINEDDMDLVAALRHSASAIKELELFLTSDDTKFEFTESSELGGVKIKGRLDAINAELGLLDVKTTKNADPASFARDFINFGYDIQMLHYSYLAETTLGKARLLVAACETTTGQVALYDVSDFVYRQTTVEKYNAAMAVAKSVIEMNECPAKFAPVAQTLNPPAWA